MTSSKDTEVQDSELDFMINLTCSLSKIIMGTILHFFLFCLQFYLALKLLEYAHIL